MVDEINPEFRLYISLQLHDSIETQTIIEFKAKKRVTISDYSFVAGVGFIPPRCCGMGQ